MSAFEITRGTVADAPEVAALGKRTFAETFVGMAYYTQEIIDDYTGPAFALDKIQGELVDERNTFLLMRRGGELAGYAKLVQREPAECIKDLRAIYLERLYFGKEFHRLGLGTKMLDALYEEGRNLRYDWLWLGVFEHNKPAIAFYQKHGFDKAGEWDWVFESRGKRYVDRDWVMRKRL